MFVCVCVVTTPGVQDECVGVCQGVFVWGAEG